MSDDDDRYLAERAAASRRMADAATDPAIRRLHLTLAEQFEERRAAGRDPASDGSGAAER